MADNPTTTVVIPQSTTENPDVKPVILRLPNTANPVWHWMVSGIIGILSLAFSGYLAYQHNVNDVQTRLTVVETSQKADKQSEDERLNRIEAKLDMLVDRLIGTH